MSETPTEYPGGASTPAESMENGPSGWSAEAPGTPTTSTTEAVATVERFTFDFNDREGYERRIQFPANVVNAGTSVMVSICEVGVFGGQVLPFQGLASMWVDNVVFHNGGLVIVRGYIGWESNLNVRLHFLIGR